MYNFEFNMPTKIYFGTEQEKRVGQLMRPYGKRVLMLYGSSRIYETGLGGALEQYMREAGIEVFPLGGVIPNPHLSHIRQAIEYCRDKEIGAILAVGGGSVIDSAKAIALGVLHQGDLWDLYEGSQTDSGALPVGAVVTVPATASECNGMSVITNDATNKKLMGFFEVTWPKFAILNPKLTLTVPAYQTAIGAFDIFSHAFERYLDLSRNSDLLDSMTEGLMKTVIAQTKIAIKEPENYQARAELMWAASVAHNDMLGPGGDFTCHEISHIVTEEYGTPHGAALAMIIPAWCRETLPYQTERLKRFAQNVWGVQGETDPFAAAIKGIEQMEAFIRNIGLEYEEAGEIYQKILGFVAKENQFCCSDATKAGKSDKK